MRAISQRDERGVGLILVVGITAIVLGLVATALLLAQSALDRSRLRSDFELSLAAAEDGIDTTLAGLQDAFKKAEGYGPAAACSVPAWSEQATQQTESRWARDKITELSGTCEVGNYVVFTTPLSTGEVPSVGSVYSMGWSPSSGSPNAVSRLVKVEYQFLPYAPTLALLTGGDLILQGSLDVTAPAGAGCDVGGVHANGEITVNGNVTVSGSVTQTDPGGDSMGASSCNAAGTVTQAPAVSVPRVSALSFYKHARDLKPDPTGTNSWYDLCTGGVVKSYSDTDPCDGQVVSGGVSGVDWDGSGTWMIDADAPGCLSCPVETATYYAHEGSIKATLGGPAVFKSLTLVAAAKNPDTCSSKSGGNIEWRNRDIKSPASGGVFMLADSDVKLQTDITFGQDGGGMLVAGDQIDLQANPVTVYGAIVAADQCVSPQPSDSIVPNNEVSNVTINFSPDLKFPFASIINQNLWLEFPGAG